MKDLEPSRRSFIKSVLSLFGVTLVNPRKALSCVAVVKEPEDDNPIAPASVDCDTILECSGEYHPYNSRRDW